VDGGDHVVAAAVAGQHRAIDRHADRVSIDDVLLALSTEQRSLLRRAGWELGGVRAALEQARRDRW